ncbi:MAG: DoxX family protein [Gordonia sp. (in: high G+C Gram-positive bacteria)]
MFIATIVVSALFAALLTFSGIGKLRRDPRQMETIRTVRFPEDRLPLLAIAEFAGAAGLLIGLAWWPLSVAAAVGTTLYFLGALISHLRVGDRTVAPVIVLLGVSIAIIVLRTLSA